MGGGILSIVSLILTVAFALMILDTWLTVNQVNRRHERMEEMLTQLQESLRREAEAPAGETRTCIQCLGQVHQSETRCPHCGHQFAG